MRHNDIVGHTGVWLCLCSTFLFEFWPVSQIPILHCLVHDPPVHILNMESSEITGAGFKAIGDTLNMLSCPLASGQLSNSSKTVQVSRLSPTYIHACVLACLSTHAQPQFQSTPMQSELSTTTQIYKFPACHMLHVYTCIRLGVRHTAKIRYVGTWSHNIQDITTVVHENLMSI